MSRIGIVAAALGAVCVCGCKVDKSIQAAEGDPAPETPAAPVAVAPAPSAEGVVQMPPACTTPDGMCVDAQGRLVIAAPNNDHAQPGAIFRLDEPGGKPYKWFNVPAHPDTGYSSPMGICFGPKGELYVCDNQKDSKGRLLVFLPQPDGSMLCETVAEGLDNANGVKYLDGRLYLTQAFLYGVKRADGAASSGLFMFAATDRDVRVRNVPEDGHCVFADTTRNPKIRGGLNGVAVDAAGNVWTGNYGDGHVWKLTIGGGGCVTESEKVVTSGIVTPDGLCADAEGNVYTADMRGDAAIRIAPDGKLTVLKKGGFVRPSEPCLWKGRLMISNYGGTTLQEVPLEGK